MKQHALSILAAAFVVMFACSAYAIHDLPAEGTKYPAAGSDAEGLYNAIVLKKPNYSQWELWPIKKEFTMAEAPHGPSITTYANKAAIQSMKNKNGMADGSIIIMENYTPDKKLKGYSVMHKIKGYNPEAGDWFWATYLAPNGYVVESGKVSSCIACHSAQKENDYVFPANKK